MRAPVPFGKYLLLDRLGGGGMGEVFRAKAEGPQGFERLVAVKRLLPNLAEDRDFVRMFIDEAKVAVQLGHANIAQIYDLGVVDGAYYMALEHVHGRDLRALFDRERQHGEPMPVAQACFIMMKVCEGLDYAHNKRDQAGRELHLVHRDVSPHNVLVSFDGEIKLIDFGVAKAAGRAAKTQAGVMVGKFGYMSPEQVRGLPIDRRSDIFACGICLYELLTGERLFVGESDYSTVEKVRNAEMLPPSTYNRKIPDELERIVLKALAKDVDDRYQNAIDLHDEIMAFVYTASEFYSRKDLGAWMRRRFARELEEDTVRLERYRTLSGAQSPVVPARPPPPRPPPPPAKAEERSISRSVNARFPDQVEVSNLVAYHDARQGARLTSEAARAKSTEEARAKRFAAAKQLLDGVEQAFYQRLQLTFDAATRGRWQATRRDLDRGSRLEQRMDDFLDGAHTPSMTEIAGWLKPETAPRPELLAIVFQQALGIPRERYPTVFELGELRNVLAHRAAFESNQRTIPARALTYLIVAPIDDNRRLIDVRADRLRDLELLCRDILIRAL